LARVLIVGCGCRGRELAAELGRVGWEVRGTSRRTEVLETLAAAGIESAPADPDRPGTVLELCGDVAVVVWLLGSANGDAVSAIHGPRLASLLERLVDSPVRGFAYEAAGIVDAATLAGGARIVERASQRWRIPTTLLTGKREEPDWAARCAAEIERLLAG
jgi:hypothetical protein